MRTHAIESSVIRNRLANVEQDGRSEVDKLDAEILVDDDVLILDVTLDAVTHQHRLWKCESALTMADAHVVEIFDDRGDLCEHIASLLLVEAADLLDAFEEIARCSSQHRRWSGWSELV